MKKSIAVCIVAAALLGWASLASSGGGLAYSALFYPSGTGVYSLLGDGGVDDGGVADMTKPPDMTRLPDLSPPPDMTPPIPPVYPPVNGRCLRAGYRSTSDGGRLAVEDNIPIYWNHCGGYLCTFNTQIYPAMCEPLKVQFYLGYKKSDCTGTLTAIFSAQRDSVSYTRPPSGTVPPKFQPYGQPSVWFQMIAALPAEPVGTLFYSVIGGACRIGRETNKYDVFYSAAMTTPPPRGTEVYASPTKWIP